MAWAFRAASSTSFSASSATLAVPSGLANGDIVVAIVSADGQPQTLGITGGSAWTQIGATQNVTNGDTQTIAVWWKQAGASEPTTYTASNSGGTSTAVSVCAWSGGAGTIDVSSIVNPNSTTIPTSPVSMAATAITTTQANDLVVYAGGVDWNSSNAPSFTGPSGFTDRAVNTPAIFANCYIGDNVQASAGSTGAVTATGTLTAAQGNYVAALLAFKIAAGAATPSQDDGDQAAFDAVGHADHVEDLGEAPELWQTQTVVSDVGPPLSPPHLEWDAWDEFHDETSEIVATAEPLVADIVVATFVYSDEAEPFVSDDADDEAMLLHVEQMLIDAPANAPPQDAWFDDDAFDDEFDNSSATVSDDSAPPADEWSGDDAVDDDWIVDETQTESVAVVSGQPQDDDASWFDDVADDDAPVDDYALLSVAPAASQPAEDDAAFLDDNVDDDWDSTSAVAVDVPQTIDDAWDWGAEDCDDAADFGTDSVGADVVQGALVEDGWWPDEFVEDEFWIDDARFSLAAAVFPLPSQVQSGVIYGPNGNDYIGTLTSSSGGAFLRRR